MWMVVLFGFNSSQWFRNPLVIVPPVGCESLAKLCWLWSGSVQPAHLRRGWIEAGGWAAELQTDWRHRQNRGHAWSTTQNKPGQTTTTELLVRSSRRGWESLAAARTCFHIQVSHGKAAPNAAVWHEWNGGRETGKEECGEGKLRFEPAPPLTLLHKWQLLHKVQLPLRWGQFLVPQSLFHLTSPGLTLEIAMADHPRLTGVFNFYPDFLLLCHLIKNLK